MDRDRPIEREAAAAAPRPDDSIFPTPTPGGTWVAGAPDRAPADTARSRDAAGDLLEPSDQDILVGAEPADTMPSRTLNDPREMTPDQLQRMSTDTTSTPRDTGAAPDRMDAPTATAFAAGAGGDRELNMAGRPLPHPATAGPGAGQREEELFARIREGMKVVDATGEDIGKVDFFAMGDPEAVTTAGQEMDTAEGGILAGAGRALTEARGEPDVPEPFHSQLVRTGYIKVDTKGWFSKDRYVPAELIAGVEGDAVRLSVTRDQLPTHD
jgi:hypothetical protein